MKTTTAVALAAAVAASLVPGLTAQAAPGDSGERTITKKARFGEAVTINRARVRAVALRTTVGTPSGPKKAINVSFVVRNLSAKRTVRLDPWSMIFTYGPDRRPGILAGGEGFPTSRLRPGQSSRAYGVYRFRRAGYPSVYRTVIRLDGNRFVFHS